MSNQTSPTPDVVVGAVASLNDAVSVGCAPYRNVAVTVGGTFVATLTAQVTIDGTNWFAVNLTPLNGGTPTPTPATGTLYTLSLLGYISFRITATAWTSGSATVTIASTCH